MQSHIEQMERGAPPGGGGGGGEEEALRAEIDALREELRAAHDALQSHPPPSDAGSGSDALMLELQRAQDANADLAAECDALRVSHGPPPYEPPPMPPPMDPPHGPPLPLAVILHV